MNPQRKWYYLLWSCFLIEAGSLTFLRGIAGKYISPLLFVIAAIAAVYVALQWIRHTEAAPIISGRKISSLLVYTLCFAALTLTAWLYLRTFFNHYPIDPASSDIIPLIKTMGDRLVNGQNVYAPVNDFGYTMYPNYLPATWLPFLAARWLHLDYRTWAFIILAASLYLYGIHFLRVRFVKTAWILFPFAIFILFLLSQPSTFGWTVEPMIAGFYLLLVLGLYRQNTWLLAGALILCLLSRYAVIVWTPFLFLLLFFFYNKRKTIYTGVIVLAGITLVFIIPFLLSSPDLLTKGYGYYDTGTLAEWDGQSWQQPGDLPFQLSQGYGFAIWFYHFGKGELVQKIKNLQLIHFAVCTIIPLLTLAWYAVKGKKWLPLKWCLLLSLKLYLVFFFAFIQVPYAYLFFTPLMVSAMIMVLLSLRKGS